MRRGSTTISFAPSRRRFFMREANTGCASVGLAPITQDHVGLLDRLEVLRAGRRAEGRLQAVAGRRMADARAGVDVVVAEAGAHQLLHEEGFFVGAARGGDAADGVAAVLGLERRNSDAAWAIASSHDTSRHGSVIFARIIGLVMRSLCVA